MIDLARLFPPEFPFDASGKNEIWFKLLRGEAVRSYPAPLSSDALTNWGASNARINNNEVKNASVWLKDVLVPKAALQIDEAVRLGNANNNFRIKDVLHQMGVNCRHLGLVRNSCVEPLSKQLVQTELIARTIKCHFNEQLRALMAQLRLPVDQPYRHLLVQLLNLVLGNRGEKSVSFWTIELKEMVAQKFGAATLSFDELVSEFDLRETLPTNLTPLIRRVLQFLGVLLTKKAQSELVAALAEGSNTFDDVFFFFSSCSWNDYHIR